MAKGKPQTLDQLQPDGPDPRPQPITAIRAGVLRSLGKPADLVDVAVRTLWDGRYRVNVWTGADILSARLAHSFFVVADDEGAILSSIPEITRQFQ